MESTEAAVDSFIDSASSLDTDRIQEIARLGRLVEAPEIAAEGEIRGYLRLLYESAARALARARDRWATGQAAVDTELQRLDVLRLRAQRLTAEGGVSKAYES